jgi:hypothetical protein
MGFDDVNWTGLSQKIIRMPIRQNLGDNFKSI